MMPESHGDNYYYHLLMLYLPWRKETEDLLGEYGTAQEVILAKRDRLQFLNPEHGSFVDEVVYKLYYSCLLLTNYIW